jgi:hypothetical protein
MNYMLLYIFPTHPFASAMLSPLFQKEKGTSASGRGVSWDKKHKHAPH